MSRQYYETESDRNRERIVAEKLEAYWNSKLVKLPVSYRVDYAVVSGCEDIIGFVEIKCRNCSSKTYDTLMISAGKICAGYNLAQVSGVPFIIAIDYSDGTFVFTYYNNPGIKLKYRGRTVNTRDSADIEPVFMIPVNLFLNIADIKKDDDDLLW